MAKANKKESVIIFRTPTKLKSSLVKKLNKTGLDMSTVLNILLRRLDELEKINLGFISEKGLPVVYDQILDKKTGTVNHRSFKDMINYIETHDE